MKKAVENANKIMTVMKQEDEKPQHDHCVIIGVDTHG